MRKKDSLVYFSITSIVVVLVYIASDTAFHYVTANRQFGLPATLILAIIEGSVAAGISGSAAWFANLLSTPTNPAKSYVIAGMVAVVADGAILLFAGVFPSA